MDDKKKEFVKPEVIAYSEDDVMEVQGGSCGFLSQYEQTGSC